MIILQNKTEDDNSCHIFLSHKYNLESLGFGFFDRISSTEEPGYEMRHYSHTVSSVLYIGASNLEDICLIGNLPDNPRCLVLSNQKCTV